MNGTSIICRENQKKGSSKWMLSNPAINREIEGYASATSVNIGETIKLFVSTRAKHFQMSIFRMGWYQGLGGRQVMDVVTKEGTDQQNTVQHHKTGMIECNWTDPFTLTIPNNWVTGVYVVKLRELKSNKESYILFVVRNDQNRSDLIFQLPVTTYQAYNYWGGKSLYDWSSGSYTDWGMVAGERANRVTFNRPYARSNNLDAAFGMGAGEFFTNVQPNTTNGYPISSASWDYNMVRWLERNGYDIGYITNLDTHVRPSILKNTKVFMSHGHDEYWSYEMRVNIKDARDKGINLAFFSSNTMFWQIRLEKKDKADKEPRIMVCYKDNETDPIKGERSTVAFRDVDELKGEAEIIGVQYILDPVHADFVVANPDHWLFENTGLKKGQKIKGLLGYEVDSIQQDSPENVIVLGNSPCRSSEKKGFMEISKYMVLRLLELATSFKNRIGLSKSITILLITLFLVGSIYLFYSLFLDFGIQTFLFPLLLVITLSFLWYLKILKASKTFTQMTIYGPPNGAKVFATGSMQWSWGLDDFNVPRLRKSYYSEKAAQITRNLLSRFGANPLT